MATTPPAPQPQEVYAVFCDAVNQESVKRLSASLSFASQNNIGHVHLLLQSTGGTVSDGVCLYNIFKALPIDLTVYNCGSVMSVAAVAFLGASKRKTSARATFMLHRTTASPQSAHAGRLHSIAESVILDDQRTESILKSHLNLSPDEWSRLDKQELWFSADEAVKAGFADEIGEFGPPTGSKLYTI
jgi:ATP-dependent Clp protease, protease subunit